MRPDQSEHDPRWHLNGRPHGSTLDEELLRHSEQANTRKSDQTLSSIAYIRTQRANCIVDRIATPWSLPPSVLL